jgi:transcriptional regulator with XRE-family HTH domain
MASEFGIILQENRKKLGITQEELADRAKIERTYMSKLEGGRSNPSFSTISKISEGLGMTIAEFFGQASEKKPATFFINIGDLKAAKKEHIIKGAMLPIRVFKDISVFSLGHDIKTQFAPRYTYIEKSILAYDYDGDEKSWPKEQDTVCGLEINRAIEFMGFGLTKGSILLVNTLPFPMISPGMCIVDTGDGKGPSILGFAYVKQGIAFFDPTKSPFWEGTVYLFKDDESLRNYVRGLIVGVIGLF